MNIEDLQTKVMEIYKKELKHEDKYDSQVEQVLDKHSDILYGKLAKIYNGKDITNKELYGPENILLKISNVIEGTINGIFRDLNISNSLSKATEAINADINKVLDDNVKISETKDEVKKQVNEKNAIDGLTLSQRLAKYKNELYNNLLKTVVINVAKKKTFIEVADDLDEKIRGLMYIHGRLMGTEMNRILNENLVSIYQLLGIKNVEFSAVLDSKTSYICTSHHGRVYPIDELIVGITQPPLHPNCRSILLPHN